MSIPPDFVEIPDDRVDLFYKIDRTGQVILTGDKQRCVLSCELADGSRLQGGITEAGNAFGTRTDKNGRTFDLRWQDVYQTVGPAPVAKVAPPVPKAPLDSALFDPPGKPTKMVTPADMSSEMAALEEQGKRALKSFERAAKVGAKEEELKGSLDTMRTVIESKTEELPERRTGLTVEMLEEISHTIESTISEVKRIQEENLQLRIQVEAENQRLRERILLVQEEAKAKLEQVTEEFARKTRTRRWLVQEAASEDFMVQGLEAKRWEIEDDKEEVNHLVVVTAVAGTTERSTKAWMEEVQKNVEQLPNGKHAVYVMTRPGLNLSVLQLLPGVDSEEVSEVASDVPQF